MKNLLIRILCGIAFIFQFLLNAVHPNVDPKIDAFLTQLANQDGPPLSTLPVEKARKILDDLQAPTVNTIPADIQDITIPYAKDKTVSVRIIRPKGNTDKLPIIMYFHGGGWILGNKNTHDRLVRQIANGANAAVVFVNYTPSPEAKFPQPIEEAYSATKYIAKHGRKFNLDTSRIAIVGDSVGGNMAAVVVQMAKQRGPKILLQILFYPVTDANFNTGSYNEFAEGIWLTRDSMKWFWDAYAPDPAIRSNPQVSPLQASLSQLRGLPPTLIIVNENDILRDEDEAYAHKLQQAGVRVEAVRVMGAIHDQVLLAPLKDTAETKFAINLAINKLKQVFYGSPT